MAVPIKDPSLVLKCETSDNHTSVIIRDGSKLAEVFSELPPGIFYKDETGMGATTLELAAGRSSIIVEPIKVTASSKAAKHGAIYVGSETAKFPVKKSVKQIAEEIEAMKKAKGFVKIVVVADSLYKVIDAIGPTVFHEYFLMLDEADSFQLDSFYRSSMEKCMDYYKQFPKRKEH